MADWRLEQLERQPFLHGLLLKRMTYRQYRPWWDHDHCVGCSVKLAEYDSPTETIEHEGFTTTDEYERGAEYHWVCRECFGEFNIQMAWRVVDA